MKHTKIDLTGYAILCDGKNGQQIKELFERNHPELKVYGLFGAGTEGRYYGITIEPEPPAHVNILWQKELTTYKCITLSQALAMEREAQEKEFPRMMEVSQYIDFCFFYKEKVYAHDKGYYITLNGRYEYAREIDAKEPEKQSEPENKWVGKFWRHSKGRNFYCTSVKGNGTLLGFGFNEEGKWFNFTVSNGVNCACNTLALGDLTQTDRLHPPNHHIKEAVEVLDDASEKLKALRK